MPAAAAAAQTATPQPARAEHRAAREGRQEQRQVTRQERRAERRADRNAQPVASRPGGKSSTVSGAAASNPAPATSSAPGGGSGQAATPPAQAAAPATPGIPGTSTPAAIAPGVVRLGPTAPAVTNPAARPAPGATPASAPGAIAGGVGAASGETSSATPARRPARARPEAQPRRASPVTRTVVRTVKEVVGVVPGFMWAIIAGLALLLALAAGRSGWMVNRTHRLERQRAALLEDVGLLQEALLPPPPEAIAGLAASAAYRPAAGAAAGGAFHEVFRLDDACLGLVVGEVIAHGRRALGLTALVRHTLRAYLEAGMAPRPALQAAMDALDSQLGADQACIAAAVHDREAATLTWATAGLSPPVILGAPSYAPVTAAGVPAIGARAVASRQTTMRLPRGAVACFFTGEVVGEPHGGDVSRDSPDGEPADLRSLWRDLSALGEGAEAEALLATLAARTGRARRDMAACVLRVVDAAPAAAEPGADRRVEELELTRSDLDGARAREFLEACGVPSDAIAAVLADLRPTGERLGSVVLRVRIGAGPAQADLGLRGLGAVPFARAG